MRRRCSSHESPKLQGLGCKTAENRPTTFQRVTRVSQNRQAVNRGQIFVLTLEARPGVLGIKALRWLVETLRQQVPRPARGPQAPEAALTVAARKIAARPSPLAVFTARCEARALLWQAGKFDLHEAVDELQAAAVRDGLVAELGQDAVQWLMAEAFHKMPLIVSSI